MTLGYLFQILWPSYMNFILLFTCVTSPIFHRYVSHETLNSKVKFDASEIISTNRVWKTEKKTCFPAQWVLPAISFSWLLFSFLSLFAFSYCSTGTAEGSKTWKRTIVVLDRLYIPLFILYFLKLGRGSIVCSNRALCGYFLGNEMQQ